MSDVETKNVETKEKEKNYTEKEEHGNILVDPEIDEKPAGRRPSKILHFSDGTLEEYSDEEEKEEKKVPEVGRTGIMGKTLKVVDYVGETVAGVFGLTDPKYNSELKEYERHNEEIEQGKKPVPLSDVVVCGESKNQEYETDDWSITKPTVSSDSKVIEEQPNK